MSETFSINRVALGCIIYGIPSLALIACGIYVKEVNPVIGACAFIL